MATSSLFTIYLCLTISVLFMGGCTAHLSEDYYSESCPNVFDTVKSVVHSHVSKEKRMGASLLRLQFHDCFINGCDGSILLDETSTDKSEKNGDVNKNSVRGFEVVDEIKASVEKLCPGVVSCADILTIAARDSVVLLRGPSWKVKLGRKDSRTANFSAADQWDIMPSFSDNLATLISKFKAQGFSAQEMVTLSGAHTIGYARCISFKDRIYNETSIDNSFAKTRKKKCLKSVGSWDDMPTRVDLESPHNFDTSYFKNLMEKKGLLHSDQELFNGTFTDKWVREYSNNHKAFYADFIQAMIKMGDIKPLIGFNGEIRKNCRKAN